MEVEIKDNIIENKIGKVGNLSFLWGKERNIRKSTDEIMKEIDEGEI
ncbi:MAG: hypothetical protein Q7S74_00625 [Nanoarchaeota archaeon]|nr:hypothetical protein [Nanoarchaeota archaeon]